MAKLSPEIRETIDQLRQRLIDIIDDATATEFILFERYGETERTIIVLDETQNRLPAWERSIEEVKLDWNLS